MQGSTHRWDTGAHAARKGHLPKLSISDENHHVTETIGYLYDDERDPDTQPPVNLAPHYPTPSPQTNGVHRRDVVARKTSIPRKQLPARPTSGDHVMAQPNGISHDATTNGHAHDQDAPSRTLSTAGSRGRSPSDTATSPFPLNDIDYESSPAGLAQELSNLQALRRMSMSVGAADDPDLPQLQAAGMPSAPSSTSSEDDSARLFWVPARLHPELAPKEFKTFLESKAEQIRRRSGELSAFTTPPSSRASSLSVDSAQSGLRRKKSMLSRQIDSSVGYQDGAERLERKRSQSRRAAVPDPNLQELETLVANTAGLSRLGLDKTPEEDTDDIILPSVPGSSLKRSTRTTYRRGGSVKGKENRNTYAARAARRAASENSSISQPASPEAHAPALPPLPSFASMDVTNLAQTLKDPAGASAVPKASATNFSRPSGREGPPSTAPSLTFSVSSSFDSLFSSDEGSRRPSTSSLPDTQPAAYASASRSPPSATSATFDRKPVPKIVEVPPADDGQPLTQPPRSSSFQTPPVRHPERVSSREEHVATGSPPARPAMPSKQSMPTIAPRTSSAVDSLPPPSRPSQALEQPSPLPGNDTNTNNLSFIPTLTVDKRADHKPKDDGKKSSWSWLLGKEDGAKDKADKPKAKINKPPQQHADNTRLDVIQSSIDGGGKGRESLVLDRDNLKLEEERKKESRRKSGGTETKKEKEGLFSSIFGGKKGKAEREHNSKKHRDRGLSPEPPYRELRPDIDYHWTRFSILEERAIYRMAHMKLANPRRALHSQVLLSNFMYSYLAKVQQMHPQMNLPTSAKHQRKQQQKDQQPDEFTQYQRYQQQQEQDPAADQPYGGHPDAAGEAPGYGYDATGQRPSSRGSKHAGDNIGSSYAGDVNSQPHLNAHAEGQYRSQLDDDYDDMW